MATESGAPQYIMLVEMLLAHGANVEATLPGFGCSALMRACETQQVLLIKKLIAARADCNICTEDAKPELSTPLACAATFGVPSTVALLVQSGNAKPNFLIPERKLRGRQKGKGADDTDGSSSSSSGSSGGGSGGSRRRGSVGAPVGGCTALHCAIKDNRLPTAAWLVHEGGASLNIATKSHDFPIHIVSRHGHIEMLRWLAQVPGFDANLRRSTMGGTADTPLHIAASKGHLELVMYLVEKCDSDVSPRLGPTKGGFSPLHCAIEFGHTAVVKYLVDNSDADVEGRGEKIIDKPSLSQTKDPVRAAFIPSVSVASDDSRPTTSFFVNSRILMGCADPLREKGGRRTPSVSSRFGSKLPR